MSNYYSSQQPQYPAAGGPNAAQNLQFFPSQYTNPGSSTPQQAAAAGYGYGNQGGYGVGAPAQNFAAPAFGAQGTLAVLNPFRRIDSHIMDDSDLAGPLIFFLLFGFILLFSGQVHFGYIYGLAALGSISLHLILSLMSPSDASDPQVNSYPQYSSDPSAPQQQHDGQQGGHFSATLTYPRSASVLGYCLLPLVATSLFGIVMRMDTPVGIVATTAAILWCTYSASGMFCAVGQMKRMRGLVAYPLALFYVGFGIMGIFSSRGSGTFSNAAAKLNA
ncbi:golgi integral membrane protein [Fusarium sp. NRRL 25303]|nr:golgi integral membrane protein [Fusarium sp. NRRL 25303]